MTRNTEPTLKYHHIILVPLVEVVLAYLIVKNKDIKNKAHVNKNPIVPQRSGEEFSI
jgi:uncharacterized membrane protein